MCKTNVAFLEGQLLSSQSEQFKKYLKSSNCQEKAGPPKSHYCFGHVNRLYMALKLNPLRINIETEQVVVEKLALSNV